MFEPKFTDKLMQGDVYRNIPIVTVQIHRDRETPAGGRETVYSATDRHRYVALLSHSCDADPTNRGRTDDVQVAALNPAGEHERDEITRFGGLGSINDPMQGLFYHWFVYASLEGVGDVVRIADFRQIQTVPRSLLRSELKVAELTRETRGKLKAKLYLHFARDEEGVPAVESDRIRSAIAERRQVVDGLSPASAVSTSGVRDVNSSRSGLD